MKTPEELAAALAAKWTTSARYQVNDAPEKRIKLIPREIEADIATVIREATAQARREALEEAAKTCELDSVLDWIGGSSGNAKGTAKKCAAAIRSLGAKP